MKTAWTVEDLRNPKRKSGFNYVHHIIRGWSTTRQYRAEKGMGGTTKVTPWHGPRRATAEEAAQDFCDHMNGQSVTIATYATPTIDMGNTTRHAPKMEAVKVIRPQFDGPHDLYDVLITTANGDTVCRKVGITARGHARYADICKTLGLSIKPYADAVTYPTKDAARAAEDAKVAEVCKDDGWRRIGKEAFAPAKEAL